MKTLLAAIILLASRASATYPSYYNLFIQHYSSGTYDIAGNLCLSTSSSTFGTCNINVDGAAGNIGIGTANPLAPLHVVGEFPEIHISTNSIPNTGIGISAVAHPNNYMQGANIGDGVLRVLGTGKLLLGTQAGQLQPAIVINGTNIGIGTMTPQGLLDVEASSVTKGNHHLVARKLENVTGTDTTGGQNSTAFFRVVSSNTSGPGYQAQGTAVLGTAFQYGTGDIVGLYGSAQQSGGIYEGAGYNAWGVFLSVNATTPKSGAFAVGTNVANNTGADQPFNTASMGQGISSGLDLVSNGANLVTLGVDLRPSGQMFDVGIGAYSGSIKTALIEDLSSAGTSILIAGAHSIAALAVAAGAGSVGIGTTSPGSELCVNALGDNCSDASIFQVSGSTIIANMTTDYENTKSGGGWNSRKARGTPSSPMAVLSGDTLGSVGFMGYNGSAWSSSANAGITGQAAENFTPSANGTKIIIQTTPAGSTTASSVSTFTANGGLSIPGTMTAATFVASTASLTGQDGFGYSLSLSSGINMPAGTVNAGMFVGSGAGLTNINVGTISGSNVSGGTFGAVNGSAITNISGSNVSGGTFGAINGSNLTNVPATFNGGNVANAINVSSGIYVTGPSTFTQTVNAAAFIGNGAGLTNLPGVHVSSVAFTTIPSSVTYNTSFTGFTLAGTTISVTSSGACLVNFSGSLNSTSYSSTLKLGMVANGTLYNNVVVTQGMGLIPGPTWVALPAGHYNASLAVWQTGGGPSDYITIGDGSGGTQWSLLCP